MNLIWKVQYDVFKEMYKLDLCSSEITEKWNQKVYCTIVDSEKQFDKVNI